MPGKAGREALCRELMPLFRPSSPSMGSKAQSKQATYLNDRRQVAHKVALSRDDLIDHIQPHGQHLLVRRPSGPI